MIALQDRPVPAVNPGTRRVLMTADAVGGVWRYSLDLARALRPRGVETTLAVMGPPPAPAQRREAAALRVPLVEAPYRLEWMDDAEDDVARAGDWLLTLEQALRPDIVHINGYAHAALGWTAPPIVVAHSCIRSWWRAVKGAAAPPRYQPYSEAVVAGLTAARAVVAPSASMQVALEREYALSLRAEVIFNGCAGAPRRPSAARPPKEPLVLAAGRLWDEAKNIATLATAARHLTWPVYVAGEATAAGVRAPSLTTLRPLGQLPHRELRRWYHRASIYALPARYEPFGLSALEAARAGCALVLGDIPSLHELWHGAAVFVPPDDATALTVALQRLIDRPAERAALGRKAAERSARFTIDRTADEYARLYARVLG